MEVAAMDILLAEIQQLIGSKNMQQQKAKLDVEIE